MGQPAKRPSMKEIKEQFRMERHREFLTTALRIVTEEGLSACRDTDDMYDVVMADATTYYLRREEELTPKVMREVERQLMLRIIDQRWREHLEEMDYLKEGINLRAMGQKDPLTEWQREGFEMFGKMMQGIAQDFVRYVMHVQVVRNDASATAPVSNVLESAPDDQSASGFQTAAAPVVGEAPAAPASAPSPTAIPQAARTGGGTRQRTVAGQGARPAKQETIVKDEWSKTPRNAPCPCGSGKKFKMCHGATAS